LTTLKTECKKQLVSLRGKKKKHGLKVDEKFQKAHPADPLPGD